MNLGEIQQVLTNIYQSEPTQGKNRHIVFWYDEESEFVDDIDELELDNVKVLKISANNSFFIKYQLEKADIHSHYLLYCAGQRPSPRNNALLDIEKYSTLFSADKTTVIMRNLGVTDEALRPVFKKYVKFFKSKERDNRFAGYKLPEYTEDTVDIAVLSALCKLDMPHFEGVMRRLFAGLLDSEENKYWEQVEKFGDVDSFWRLAEKYYGFTSSDHTLDRLFASLVLTGLSYNLEAEFPRTWAEALAAKKPDCLVFINHFMNDASDKAIYDRLARKMEEKLKVREYLKKWDIAAYRQCDVFPVFDEAIINSLVDRILHNVEDYTAWLELIEDRRTLHWYAHFQNEYEAIYWAVRLLACKKEIGQEFKRQSCYDGFQEYCTRYYQIDTAYRKFYAAYDRAEDKDRLMMLADRIENIYANWFLNELAVKCSTSIKEELEEDWPIKGISRQQDFFQTYIRPHVNKGERVFVIISDALRFEAARELCDQLNKERRGSAEIYAIQGVLPSATKFGMASLLPHKSIKLDSKNEIYIDDIRAEGTENRHKILSAHVADSIALSYNDIVNMSQKTLRQVVQGKKVVYIYHNLIDGTGDHWATERQVFAAVEDTFRALRVLINDLVNGASASTIYVTADHGFIYKRGSLAASDKTAQDIDAAEETRRYLLTDQRETADGTICVAMDYLLGQGCGKFAVVPKGTNRFSAKGQGANYIHGGAMPQEIVIPVIRFKNERSKSGKHDLKKVSVKLTSISRKITNSITYLEFFQVEKAEDKVLPLRLKLYFTDEEGSRISNENIIIADSRSDKPEGRTFREKFTFKSLPYDKKKQYYLVLEDEEADIENIYERIPFTIDLAITNDFGF